MARATSTTVKFPDFDIYDTGKTKKIFMNGALLEGVTDIRFEMNGRDASHVTITFVAGSVNGDSAALAALLKGE